MIYQHIKKSNPNTACGNLTSPIPPIIATTIELSLKVQEQGIGDVTLGQSDAKMQLNWDVVQESSDFGND